MSENEQKALALVAEAEKKLNSSKTFLGGLFGYLVFRLSHRYRHPHEWCITVAILTRDYSAFIGKES